MNEILTASFELRFISPAFIGGANMQGPAVLHPSSIRGALHFWLRALVPGGVQPQSRDKENMPLEVHVFGGQSQQSAVSLHCEAKQLRPWPFDGRKDSSPATRNQRGTGLDYLGYPFTLRGGSRGPGLAPDSRFIVHVSQALRSSRGLQSEKDAAQHVDRAQTAWKGFLTALWGLGTFGGLGARSRRGFGSVSLQARAPMSGTSTELVDRWNEDLSQLQLLATTKPMENIAAWNQAMIHDLVVIQQWFKHLNARVTNTIHHPNIALGKTPYIAVLQAQASPFAALQQAGHELRTFRSRKQPDYNLVKNFLQGHELVHVPPRVSFGLPLNFRFNSLNGKRCEFRPNGSSRFASLLHLRIVQTQAGFSPVFHLMDGERPGVRLVGNQEQAPRTEIVVDRQRQSFSLSPMAVNESAVDQFMQHLESHSHG